MKPTAETAEAYVTSVVVCSGLQVAGVRVFHSTGAFRSVVQLKPDGSTAPINPNAKYTIVATDYMLQGGDGFRMFKDAEVLLPAGLPYAEQVIEDLKLFPQGVSSDPPGYYCTMTAVMA
jgi:2',3'-cyclic-nucleotide 2'-phosphodiesterase (5'-nucleotidase family)